MWWPLTLSGPVFWGSFIVFTAISILARIYAAKHYEKGSKGQDVIGRYWACAIHAVLCVGFWFYWGDPVFTGAFSVGYFMADMVVDRDLEYIFHHIVCMVILECFIHLSAPYYPVACFVFVEFGNIFSHWASLFTLRSGKVFHYINVVSFWISRPLSAAQVYPAVLSQSDEVKAGWAIKIVLAAAALVYAQNLRWMIIMVLPRKNKDKTAENADNGQKKTVDKPVEAPAAAPNKVVPASRKKAA